MLIGLLSHPGILVIDDRKQKTFPDGESQGPAGPEALWMSQELCLG